MLYIRVLLNIDVPIDTKQNSGNYLYTLFKVSTSYNRELGVTLYDMGGLDTQICICQDLHEARARFVSSFTFSVRSSHFLLASGVTMDNIFCVIGVTLK